jgi:hypothetical protein
LLLTDEKFTKILKYDTQRKTVKPVKANGIDIRDDNGEMGIEGIAVQGDSICYLLKERDRDCRSQIRVFRIVERNGQTEIDFAGINLLIQHPKQSDKRWRHHWRYSDLFFDGKLLYGIRSYFEKGGSPNNQYYIDTINVNAYKKRGEYMLTDTILCFKDLSAAIRSREKKFATNVEGITIFNGKI